MSSASRSSSVPVKDLKEDKFRQQQQGKDANRNLKGNIKGNNLLLSYNDQALNKWQVG